MKKKPYLPLISNGLREQLKDQYPKNEDHILEYMELKAMSNIDQIMQCLVSKHQNIEIHPKLNGTQVQRLQNRSNMVSYVSSSKDSGCRIL